LISKTKEKSTKKELVFPCCEVCGYDKYVTRHRLRPGRKGGGYVCWNVVGLCSNCHAEAEMKLISPYELFKILFKRIQDSRKIT